MKPVFLLITTFISTFVVAQTNKQVEHVLKNTNKEALYSLKNTFDSLYQERQIRIDNYLNNNPHMTLKTKKGVSETEIYDVIDGELWFYHTSNYNSSITSRANLLYEGGGLGLNLHGQGMLLGVWDAGSVRDDHVEFSSRAYNLDFSPTPSDHATHVMGTVLAEGIDLNLRGIAFESMGYSYDWTQDYSEMASAAATGLLVSNHSYWVGTSLSEWILGAYDQRAMQFDQIAFNAPYYLAVTSAGNDRSSYDVPVLNNHLINKYGYDLIRGMSNAKNFLTVGAIHQVLNYTGPNSVVMSSFSSWGPTDDGRIKPELVAKGVSVHSTLTSSTTDSGPLNGTSMASPSVAAVALLLQQHSYNLFDNYKRAATIKGLMMHTADECGYYDGPDYEYGWGLVNAANAVNTLTESQDGQLSIVEEFILNEGETYNHTVIASGNEPLQVSISWTDPAGEANTGDIDPTALYLVNDLDLRVLKGSEVHYPWTLDPSVPYNQASQNTDNFRDNYEKVQIDNPFGTYVITITHKGNLQGGIQNYSLIVTGLSDTASVNDLERGLFVFPNPVQDILNFETTNELMISQIEIYDTIGKRVFASELNNNSINISDLTQGVYMVKIYSEDGGYVTKKIIKK